MSFYSQHILELIYIIKLYMLAIDGQTAEPNWLKSFEGIHG